MKSLFTRRTGFQWLILVSFFITALPAAIAQIPQTISYQGQIQSGGAPLTGQHLLHVALYDSLVGGNLLYEESHQAMIANGVFSILLGSVTPFPGALSFDRAYYLSISIDGASELAERTPLASAPYALNSHLAELAGGLTGDARGVVTSINEVSGAIRLLGDSTTTVTQNGNAISIHAKPVVSGGNGIQSIASSDNTIAISSPTGPNANVAVADNAISTSKIKDGAVTASKLGQDGATSGQVLKWNGTAWVPSSDLSTTYTAGNGVTINGNTISVSQPLPPGTVTNSTLRYSGTSWVENTNLLSTAAGLTTVNNNLLLSNVGAASELHFYEPSASGNNYSSFAAQAQSANIIYLLPANPPLANQALTVSSVTGSGPYTVTLGWQNAAGSNWLLTGNSGTTPGTNFLGTTDANPLAFRTSNLERMRLDANGNLGIGTNAPQQSLEVKNGNLLISNSANSGNLIIATPGGANTTSITTSAQTSNITYKLPSSIGSVNQVLSISGIAGNTATLGWTNAGTANAWNLTGNSGTTVGTNFLGTTDLVPFTIKVNNQRALFIDPETPTDGAVDIILGIFTNSITNPHGSTPIQGSTIGGGGSQFSPNTITDHFATISGGDNNAVNGNAGVIGGGQSNSVNQIGGSIGGGFNNTVSSFSSIPGGINLKLGSSSFGFNGVNYSSTNPIVDLSSYSKIAYFGDVNLMLGNVDNSARELLFYEPNASLTYAGTNYSSFKAGVQSTDLLYTLPTSAPTLNQVLSATAITGSGPYAVTLGWADPGSGSGYVLYGPSAVQSTLTPRTTPLFNIAYISTAADAAAAGATITSSAGAAGNLAATALTLVATATGTGLARALNATGRVNIDNLSSYDIAGNRFLWEGPSHDATVTMVGNTGNTTNSGASNILVGSNAGKSNTSGYENVVVGPNALSTNTTGFWNIAVGSQTMNLNTTGTQNVAIGAYALSHNTVGGGSIAIGTGAISTANANGSNIAIGDEAGSGITTGYDNTIIGGSALESLTTGMSNTVVGFASGSTTSSTVIADYYEVTLLGAFANHTGVTSTLSLTNSTAVGAFSYVTQSNSMVLGSINGLNSATADTKVGIGTTAPLQKFNVENGNILLSRTGSNGADSLSFQGTSTGVTSFAAGAQGTTNINYTLPTSQPTANQILSATAVAGSGPYAVTLGWADPFNGSGFVNYGPTSVQATLTPRTTPLFNIAYISTAANANAAGATITSSAGTGGNLNATGLTVKAIATGTGLARAIDATGRVNIDSVSSYDIKGDPWLWRGPTADPTVTMVGNTQSNSNTGGYNVFLGWLTGTSNTTGQENTFVGAQTGISNTTGSYNSFYGSYGTAGHNTTGSFNSYFGISVGVLNTTGSKNSYFGANTGINETGSDNSYFGVGAGASATTAVWNTFAGEDAGFGLTTGSYNTHLGGYSGYYNYTGSHNTYIGYKAGMIASGSNNTFIGDSSGCSNTGSTTNSSLLGSGSLILGTISNAAAIGALAEVSAGNSLVLGSINGINGASADVYVGIGTTSPLQKLNVENGNILLSRTGTNGADSLKFQGTGTGVSSFAAGAQNTTNINYTLPLSQPTANQVLSASAVSGSGPYAVTLGWANAGGTAWNLTGNASTTPGTNFIGTTDNQAFEIHIYDGDASSVKGDKRVMRYEYGLNAPIITGGYHGNTSSGDASVICGGGTSSFINSISSSATLTFLGGGRGNTITGQYSVIGGGDQNTVGGTDCVIGGGYNNIIDYLNLAGNSIIGNATISGGTQNHIEGVNCAIPGGFQLTLGDNSFGFNAQQGIGSAPGTANLTTGAGPFTNVGYFGNVDLWIGNTGTTASTGTSRQLRFYQNNSNSNYPSTIYFTSFQAPSTFASGSISYTLPAAAPVATGNLLLATSGSSSTMSWSTGLVWDNTNSRLGVNTTSPSHPIHSVNSATTDEMAAVYGNATGSTTNQAIGIWGDASNTTTTNTGTIGVFATGNGNTTSGQTNIALQVNDGEFTMGRTTEAPAAGTDVNGAAGGTAYSAEGPSGVVEFTLGGTGNLVTAAPTVSSIQDLGSVTINNRYAQIGSIVLVNVVGFTDDGNAPDPKDAAFIVNADNTASGSFKIRVKMIPTLTNAANYTVNDKVKIGYMIVNKSR